jgi:Rrf2 family protein
MQGGFQISRKSDYALRAVIYLARNEGQHPVSFRQIAQTEYIPEEYLAKILRTLVLMRLVSSTRGAKGGYTLARRSTEISFLDVIESIDGPISINLCLGTENNCPAELNCLMHSIWQKAQNAMKEIFKETKISDVIEQQTSSPPLNA